LTLPDTNAAAGIQENIETEKVEYIKASLKNVENCKLKL